DPKLGYATDFVSAMDRLLPDIRRKGIKVIANAGGVNPRACADAVLAAARKHGLTGLRVATVTGDDLLGRLDDLLGRGVRLANMATGEELSTVRGSVQSANAYLGAGPVVLALKQGADIVITGRVTDTGLTLGPIMHAFGWAANDWNRLAAGTVAGHI